MSLQTLVNVASLLNEAESSLRSDPNRSLNIVASLSDAEVLTPAEQARAMLISSRAYIHTGLYADGRPMALRAIEFCRQHHLWRELGLAHMEMGIYHFVDSDYDQALFEYEAAEKLLTESGSDADLARVYVNVANVYHRTAEYHNSTTMYEKALELARRAGDDLTQAKVLTNLSGLYQYVLSDLETSLEYTDMAIAIYTRLGDPIGLSKSYTNKGNYLKDLGRFEEAIDCYAFSLQERERFFEPAEIATTYVGYISSLYHVGRNDEGDKVLENEFRPLVEMVNGDVERAYLNVIKSISVSNKGRYDEACDLIEEAWAIFNERDAEEIAVALLENKANHLMKAGRYKEATEALGQLLEKKAEKSLSLAETRLIHFKGKFDIRAMQTENELERVKNVELAQAVQHLQDLHRENDEYVALLAHELRSPLNSIRAISAYLTDVKTVTSEERAALEKEIHGMSTRMLDLIGQVLERAKSRHHMHDGICDALPVWIHIIGASELKAEEKKIQFNIEFEDRPIPIRASEQDLITIADNLVSNAIKYSHLGSEIGVSVAFGMHDGGRAGVILTVTDKGQGFTEEDLKRMFRPFEKLTSRPTGNESSTGLGLHLVKRAVDRLGGRIRCESTHGQGATFIVELPLVE